MMERRTVALGFLMLLAASYLDNVRGPLVPLLTEEFYISYGTTTWFLVLGNLGAVVALFLLLPVLQIFSITQVAKCLCFFFALLSVYLFRVRDLTGLFIFATLLGSMIPAFGALANLFLIQGTSEKDRSKWMCALHMVYGGASLLAPLVVSVLVSKHYSWNSPFLFYLPFIAITLAALYLKPKTKNAEHEIVAEKQAIGLPRTQWLSIAVFCFYVTAEVMVSVWMISYLKEVRQLSLQQSAPYLSGFFVMMTLSRGVSFFSLNEQTEKKMLFGCLLVSALGLFAGYNGMLLGFVFAGLLGPFFPVFLSLCSRKFIGHSRSFTLWVLASTQFSLGMLNLILGKVSDRLGMGTAYKIPVLLLGFSLVLLSIFFLKEKKTATV